MTWLRIDDKFPRHEKVLALNDHEFRVHVGVLCYCAEYKTRGRVPSTAWPSLGITPKIARRFIEVGIWDDDDGVFAVHDFTSYNPVDPTGAERKRRFRERQRDDKRDGKRDGGGTVDKPVDNDGPERPEGRTRDGTGTAKGTLLTRGQARAVPTRPQPQPLARGESALLKPEPQPAPVARARTRGEPAPPDGGAGAGAGGLTKIGETIGDAIERARRAQAEAGAP